MEINDTVYFTIYVQHSPSRTRSYGKKSQSRMLRNPFLSQIFGKLEFIIILSFNFTICLIFICGILFLLIVFHIPLCNVRHSYTGCPFTCYLAEITRNETVWRMRANNVKGVYCFTPFPSNAHIGTRLLYFMCEISEQCRLM